MEKFQNEETRKTIKLTRRFPTTFQKSGITRSQTLVAQIHTELKMTQNIDSSNMATDRKILE